MHLSRYLKFFPYPADSEHTLLYSTKNSAMALIPQDICNHLQQGEIPEEYEKTLTELDMLVSDVETERNEVLTLLNEVNRLDAGLNVSIILGMACNFSCIYCYEGSMKEGQAMDNATVTQVVSFLQERYIARKKKKLRLDFYGGEPLLYIETIIDIAGPLKKHVENLGGEFHFSLVTNGSLLTRDRIKKLLPVGLFAAKVTVDGPADEHNRLRPFASGKPSFEIILNNIRDCNGLIKIGFGGNYTSENYTKVPELLDCLDQYDITPKTVGNVQFHPVMQTDDQFANPEFTGGCLSVDEPWLVDASIAIRREVLQRGFKTPKISPSPCMVDLEDAFVINYDGKLYKCVAMIGHEKYAAGDIQHGFNDYRQTYHLDHWQENTACRECEYLPLCFGGCRYMEFQRTGSMAKVECMRNYYESVLQETVQQDACFQPGPTEQVD